MGMAKGVRMKTKSMIKKSWYYERARCELLHCVFNVVWLPGVARLHGGARGAARWHPDRGLSRQPVCFSRHALQLTNSTRARACNRAPTRTPQPTNVRPPRSGRGAETHQQLSPSHKSSGCPRAKPRAFLSSARTGASSKLRSAVLYLRDG